MKTLIINGSTRKNGDTQALVDAISRALYGEIRILGVEDPISPCRDCRFCWKKSGCAIQDGMQDVYPYLEDCDNLVIASPIWFSTLSGPTLNMASRFQTYFAGKYFRRESTRIKPKNGVILLAGGEPGTEKKPIETAQTILKHGNARGPIAIVCSMRTNEVPAREDTAALTAIKDIANQLNQLCDEA